MDIKFQVLPDFVKFHGKFKVLQFVGNFNELSIEDKFIVLMSDPNICTFTAKACHDMFIKLRAILYK